MLSGSALLQYSLQNSWLSHNQLTSVTDDNLVQLMLRTQAVTPALLAHSAAKLSGCAMIDLTFFNPEHIANDILSHKLLRKHGVLPLSGSAGQLFIATADPTDTEATADIHFNTGLQPQLLVAEYDKLHRLLEQLLNDIPADITVTQTPQQHLAPQQHDFTDSDAQPVIRYLNQLLQQAAAKKASDLHIEPYQYTCRIRFRIDGLLHDNATIELNTATALTARLKILAQLNIAEKRLPQDGRTQIRLPDHSTVDCRISTLPTLWGEKTVIRLLNNILAPDISLLGYSAAQQQLYLSALQQPQGMILVTGPTGSGKTVSLYAGLNQLNNPAINISTAEDPIEISLEHINQLQVNNRIGLTFVRALKAFLRQDPDVIMLGEIRDQETAEIAIKAAQTGHLVMSTLHTNSAIETLTRLRNMGIPAYDIAGSLSLIIAQRLIRCLCPHCKQPEKLSEQQLLQQGFMSAQLCQLTLFKSAGCSFCSDGYTGRTGIYEMLPITPAIAQMIVEQPNNQALQHYLTQQQFCFLRQSGLEKVAAGISSLAELNRVVSASWQN